MVIKHQSVVNWFQMVYQLPISALTMQLLQNLATYNTHLLRRVRNLRVAQLGPLLQVSLGDLQSRYQAGLESPLKPQARRDALGSSAA